MPRKNRFTVLEGGRDKQITVNSLTLKIVSDSQPSLSIDVRVFEEDTYLVLTVDPVMRYTEEHPIRLMTKVAESKPNKPGSVITNNSSWYAIIHDLDHHPTWRKEWVEKAYQHVLSLAEIKQVRQIGLPILGSVHGTFPAEKSLEMLIRSIRATSFATLEKIHILVPQADCKTIWSNLRRLTRPKN